MKLLKFAAVLGIVFSTCVTGTLSEAAAKPRIHTAQTHKAFVVAKKASAHKRQPILLSHGKKHAVTTAARQEKRRLAALHAHRKVLASQRVQRHRVGIVARNDAPLAYQIYCLKNPSECKKGGKATITNGKKVSSVLATVNSRVNHSMRAVRDRGDVWSSSGKSGDCEDFALTKRKALIKAGLPASALRMAVVRTRTGSGHAVLVVKTSSGDLVLDNLRPTIVERKKTGYRWLGMASANPARWSAL